MIPYKTDTEISSYIISPRFLIPLDLSNDARVLYALLLDRAGISRKKGCIEADGTIRLYFPVEDAKAKLRRSRRVTTRTFHALESCGLIVRRKQGLYRIVLETIQRTLVYVRIFRKDFKLEMPAQDEESREAELAEKQKSLSGAKKRMEDLDEIVQHIHEDNALGKLSDNWYLKVSCQYEKEQAELEQLAAVLKREIETQAGQVSHVNEFLKLVDKYLDIPELDGHSQ